MKQEETQQSLHFLLFLHPGGEPGLGRLMWEALREAGGGASAVRRALSGCVSAAQGGKETGVDSQPLIRWRISAVVSRPPVPPGDTTRSDESFRTKRCEVHTSARAQRHRKHPLGGSAVAALLQDSCSFTHTQLIQICEAAYKTSSLIFSLFLCSSGTVVPDLIFLRHLSPLQQLRCCCSAQVNSCDGLKAKRLWLSPIGIWSINVSQHTKQGSLKVDTFVCQKILELQGKVFFLMLKKKTSLCC